MSSSISKNFGVLILGDPVVRFAPSVGLGIGYS